MAYAGILGFVAVLVLAVLRVPIAIAMAVVGLAGSTLILDWRTASFVMASLPFEAIYPYGFAVIPLFIFMGVFSVHSGLSGNLFKAVAALIGHRPGGLAASTIGAGAVFGAICGSSLATCATIGRIALPEMSSRGYPIGLAGAVVAASGTLGILIPPSIILIIYALLTEQSIGALFAAAFMPGMLAVVLYLSVIRIWAWFRPEAMPVTTKLPLRERWMALLGGWDALLLILAVLGGIYTGVFSPTEAAAVGAAGAVLFTIVRGRLSKHTLTTGLLETASMTGMIFLILIGAALFNFFIEASGLTSGLVQAVTTADVSPMTVIVLIVVFYLVMGCFMDSLSMILLTVAPAYSVVVTGLGMDPIWFGVIVVSVAEVGLISPPIGMNLFVTKGVSQEPLPLSNLAVSILPFIGADFVRITLLVMIPAISLWLPGVLGFLSY